MSHQHWTLLDVEQDICEDDFRIAADLIAPGLKDFTVEKRTLRGGLRDGMSVVEIDNGQCRMTVLPDRGMGVWRGECQGFSLGWNSPVKGPVHPKFVNLFEPSGIGWVYGFDEWIVRCGLENNGAPEWTLDGRLLHSLHGRIANLPVHTLTLEVDSDDETITLTGIVDEARLFGQKLRLVSSITTRIGQPGFTIRDTIQNLSQSPADLQLLYHMNFGMPFVAPGARFNAAVRTLAPKDVYSGNRLHEWQAYGPKEIEPKEMVYFFELLPDADGRARTLLTNASGDAAVGVRFPTAQFPIFTLWKSPQHEEDGYVTGLEPCINFPNTKSFEKSKGRVAVLKPGEKRTFEIEIEVVADEGAVRAAEGEIARLQATRGPEVHKTPHSEWSPV